MTGSNSFWLANPGTSFYNGVATQSLRFEDGSDTYLYNVIDSTPSSTTQTTVSFWVKRASLGDQIIFCGYTSAPNVAHYINFNSADKLVIYLDKTAGGSDETNWNSGDMVFRDTTNFYHILVQYDVGQASNDNKVKAYVNGSQITLTASQTGSAVTAHRLLDSGIRERWGNYFNSGVDFDGYLAEVNVIDGQVVSQNSFGETKNGVWIAKKYTGSYGNNGYRFQFKETGDGQSTASSSTIGADTSGNNHHFQDYNFDAHDSNMPDSPENNFANLSVLNSNSNASLFEGGLRATMGGSGNYDQVRSDFGLANGKWYWEVYVEERGYIPSIGVMAGYTGPSDDPTHWVTFGFGGWFITYNSSVPQYMVNQNASGGTNWSVTLPANGDVIMVAIDVDNNKIWWGLNGTFYNSSGTANPATGADARVTLTANQTWHPVLTLGTGASSLGHSNAKMRMNFGQDPSFAGSLTGGNVGTETDGNGNGLFKYAPPSGYLACCSSSLPDLTIGPNSNTQADDYFNTIIYTGDGASSRSITGVGFQPDWIWYKHRSIAYGHVTYDSSRGTGENHLRIDGTIAEGDYNDLYGTLTSFDSDGITVAKGDDSSAPDAFFNTNSATMVGWNWKANGGTTSTNDASATSVGTIDSVYQANTTAGFSIVTHTGTGSAGTIAHGLGKKPAFIITKGLSSGYNWFVYNHESGATKATILNTTAAEDSYSTTYNNTEPTTSVFSVGSATATNGSGINYINYIFAEIEGYSKFGKYTGNGSTDGTFVFTGFRPAFVMVKNTNSSSDSWHIYDNKRDTVNLVDSRLNSNSSSVEDEVVPFGDFLSNGFKLRPSSSYLSQVNGNNNVYIYMAFAEQPFKFSNAR